MVRHSGKINAYNIWFEHYLATVMQISFEHDKIGTLAF